MYQLVLNLSVFESTTVNYILRHTVQNYSVLEPTRFHVILKYMA